MMKFLMVLMFGLSMVSGDVLKAPENIVLDYGKIDKDVLVLDVTCYDNKDCLIDLFNTMNEDDGCTVIYTKDGLIKPYKDRTGCETDHGRIIMSDRNISFLSVAPHAEKIVTKANILDVVKGTKRYPGNIFGFNIRISDMDIYAPNLSVFVTCREDLSKCILTLRFKDNPCQVVYYPKRMSFAKMKNPKMTCDVYEQEIHRERNIIISPNKNRVDLMDLPTGKGKAFVIQDPNPNSTFINVLNYEIERRK